MAAHSKTTIQTEVFEASSLAAIYGKSEVASGLEKKLVLQGLRVVTLPHPGDVLSILERPQYIFFFVSLGVSLPLIEDQLREAAQSGLRSGARFVLLLSGVATDAEKELKKIINDAGVEEVIVELQGSFEKTEFLNDALGKIVRVAFSQRDAKRHVLFGGKKEKHFGTERSAGSRGGVIQEHNHHNPEKVLAKLEAATKRQKRWNLWRSLGLSPRVVGGMALVILVLTLILAPFFWVGIQTAVGVGEIIEAKNAVLTGEFALANRQALLAKSRFLSLKEFLNPVVQKTTEVKGFSSISKYYLFLELLEQSTDTVQELVVLGPKVAALPEGILRENSEVDIEKVLSEIEISLPLIDERIGLLQAKADEALSDGSVSWLRFFGFPETKLLTYRNLLPDTRRQLGRTQEILKVIPDIIALHGEKKYLVVFQNSAELRPTGGFIGSYGLVSFKEGRLKGFQIFDVYAADGQLHGQVIPPDEVLHYLGQPNWFMRDANFSPDFPLTAKRLEWFLNKETGQKVDGVIGLDVGAVQKLLEATGPVRLPDFDDIVGAEDFYHKTQYQAEINFFPGSTKKRDYLGAVAEAIVQTLANESHKSWLKLSDSLQQALTEKNIQIYFDNQETQKPFVDNQWDGTIRTGYCGTIKANCLMVVESNFGANKANFFIQRNYKVQSVIDKAGTVYITVTLKLQNDSPSESWPGGRYKNYLRFLVPKGSKFLGLDLGDGRQATVSSSLTAEIISSVQDGEFLVNQAAEQVYTDAAATSGLTSYGVLVELPIDSAREIVFRYSTPYQLNFSSGKVEYRFGFLKQPGVGSPLVDFSVEHPSFLRPMFLRDTVSLEKYDLQKPDGEGPLVFPQKIIFNSDLRSNRFFEVHFSK